MTDPAGDERLFEAAAAAGVGDDAALPGLEMLRAVLDSVPGRVVALDTTFRYVYVNREFLDFFSRYLFGHWAVSALWSRVAYGPRYSGFASTSWARPTWRSSKPASQ